MTDPTAADRLATGQQLRQAMSRFVTGIAVATTYRDHPDGRRHDAVTLNSLISLSLTPPLVGISLTHGSSFLADAFATGRWALSIMPQHTEHLARAFAAGHRERPPIEQFAAAAPGEATGCLLLTEHTAWLELSYHQADSYGDHILLVGRVLAAGRSNRPPLVFHRSEMCSLGTHSTHTWSW